MTSVAAAHHKWTNLAEQQMNAALFSSLSISTCLILLIPTVVLWLICNTLVKQQAFHMLHMLAFKHAITHVFFPLKHTTLISITT